MGGSAQDLQMPWGYSFRILLDNDSEESEPGSHGREGLELSEPCCHPLSFSERSLAPLSLNLFLPPSLPPRLISFLLPLSVSLK